MSPEQLQIRTLTEKVEALEEVMRSFTNAAQIDPLVGKAIAQRIIPVSTAVVTDYDRSVNEGGASSYTVPKVYDGLFTINGKIIGYYNIV